MPNLAGEQSEKELQKSAYTASSPNWHDVLLWETAARGMKRWTGSVTIVRQDDCKPAQTPVTYQ